MELAHAVADDARGLLVPAVPGETEQLHRVEDAAMDRLQPVADVRQRAPDDDGHRVVQVRLPHLLFDRDVDLAIRHGLRLPYTSRFATSSACFSMKRRRGSTASPMSTVNISSAPTASSIVTFRRVRVSGFIVVSQSCSGFISPRPL